MGTCKGNDGHFMQHWTLCKVLSIANEHHSGLNYIDAHAMAPLSIIPPSPTLLFQRVQAGLPGQKSVYEKAWHELAPNPSDGYPSSANFVRTIWQGDFSMLLCEINPHTADEIDSWLPEVRALPNCKKATLKPEDWRKTFDRGLLNPKDMGLTEDALTFLSFDPYMIGTSQNRRLAKEKPGNMYPYDLDLVASAATNLQGAVVIQLSTYSANLGDVPKGANSQALVTNEVDRCISKEFTRVAKVRVNGNMMSLIYTRGVDWANNLESLEERFPKWLGHYR